MHRWRSRWAFIFYHVVLDQRADGLLDGDQIFFACDLLTHTDVGHGEVCVWVFGRMEVEWEWSMNGVRVS